jgi:hypothetical protein
MPSTQPIPFEPKSVHKTVTAYRKKFPNLTTVKYEYPENENDDSYVLHIRNEEVVVDLESHISLEMYPLAGQSTSNPDDQLPPIPKFDEFSIGVHTLAITVIGGPCTYYVGFQPSTEQLARSKRWQDWIYRNDKLDRRINSVDICVSHARPPPAFFCGAHSLSYRPKEHRGSSSTLYWLNSRSTFVFVRSRRELCSYAVRDRSRTPVADAITRAALRKQLWWIRFRAANAHKCIPKPREAPYPVRSFMRETPTTSNVRPAPAHQRNYRLYLPLFT